MSTDPINDLEQSAELAEECGNFEEAFSAWSRLARQVNLPEIYCRAGLAAQELGRWADSESLYADALRLDSSSAAAMECMGQLYLLRTDATDEQNFREAKEWLTRALEINRSARVLNFLGNAYAGLGDESEARRAFREALEVDPTYEEALYSLALVEKIKNPEGAIELLRQAIEIDPGYFRAHQQLGILLQKQGDLVAAEYEFRRCLEVCPDDYWSLLYLANTLAVQGRIAEAEQQFRLSLSLRPDDEDGIKLFASFLEAQGRHDEARAVAMNLR